MRTSTLKDGRVARALAIGVLLLPACGDSNDANTPGTGGTGGAGEETDAAGGTLRPDASTGGGAGGSGGGAGGGAGGSTGGSGGGAGGGAGGSTGGSGGGAGGSAGGSGGETGGDPGDATVLDAGPTPDAGPPPEVGPPVVPQQIALLALDEASARPMEVRFEGGVPTTIRMDVAVPPEPNGDKLRQGLGFLERFKDVYRLRSPVEQLYLDRVSTRSEDALQHLYFRQRHQGLPVFGAMLNMQMSGDAVRMTHGRWLPDLPAFRAPALSAERAVGLALARPGAALQALGKPMRGIVDTAPAGEAATPRQVYRTTLVGLDETGERGMWTVFLDADTGDTVKRLTQIMDHDDWKDLDVQTANGTDSDYCWLGPAETDDDYWFDEDGPDGYVAANDTWGDGQRAYDLGHELLDFFHDRFGLHSYDGSEAQLEIMTNVGQGFRNASFVSPCDMIKAGYTYIQRDILAHEFTHGIDVHAEDLDYENQSGALDESFADVFGYLFDPEDTTMGEDLNPMFTNNPPPFRDMANPPARNDPDHMTAALSGDGVGLWTIAANNPAMCGTDPAQCNDQGFVHTNSGIPNKVAMLLILGGVHNGRVIEALGPEKVGKLYLSVLRDGVSSTTQFAGARDLLVDRAAHWADTGHAGFASSDVCQVRNAWASVGVAEGGGDTNCDGQLDNVDNDNDGDGVLDVDDNCPIVRNWPQADQDGDDLGNECDPDLDGDGTNNGMDNCPIVPNGGQTDADGDGVGDLCDDADRDGVIESMDNCPDTANWDQEDLDMDGEGDACDDDWDGDVEPNETDNCPTVVNFGQANADGDAHGDACDNCVDVFNDTQSDCDGDGIGQACEAQGDPDRFLPVDCDPTFGIQQAQVIVLPGDLVALPACNGCDLDNRFEGIMNEVIVALPAGQTIAVIDEQGHRVGNVTDNVANLAGIHTMTVAFPVRSGAAYFEPEVSGGAGFAARQFFLQVTPALGGAGAPFGLAVQMVSAERN
jgi:Zn-dependent metalloprotease